MGKRFGFTLAEILVTLGVIGVVAAMTIPTVLQNAQEQATVTTLKKFYSSVSQAYTQVVNDNGTPDTWGIADFATPSGSQQFLNTLLSGMKVSKNCGSTINSGCFQVTYYNANGVVYASVDSDQNLSRAVLADGVAIATWGPSSVTCSTSRGPTTALSNICLSLLVDTNGLKKPNKFGTDAFIFYVTKYGIIPSGSQPETFYTFNSYCKDANNGQGCAAWVLYNDNMDYLDCTGLSWSGPTKCN